MSALPVTPLTFASEHMGNEFTVIRYACCALPASQNLHEHANVVADAEFVCGTTSDFLESLGEDQQALFPEQQGIPVNTTEKFFITAANPSDGTNEDRLTQVINAKFEAGFLKPYNYVNGYSRLQRYMDSKYVFLVVSIRSERGA